MLKKAAAFFCVLLLLSACTAIQVNRDQFEPEMLGLTPGSTTADLNLNWYATVKSGNVSQVRFFDEKGLVSAQAYQGTVSPASKGKAAHKVSIKGLKPDTQYRYSVSNDGINWSREYNYRTAKTDRFSFALVGDPQLTRRKQDGASNLFSADKTTARGWKDTLKKIAAADVDFIAGVGDYVNHTSKGDEKEYRNFFAPAELRAIPLAPAVGNHDRHYPFMYHFNLPNEQKFDPIVNDTNNNDPETGTVEAAGNYWYLYNNTLFVVLNTSAFPDSADAARPYIDRFDKTLSAAVSTNKEKYTWLFVQHHKPTVAYPFASKDVQYYVEAGFEKLMDTYNVDFVLSGHDHVYVRSYAIRDGKPVNTGKDLITNPGGTIYLTANTASGHRYYDTFDTERVHVSIQNKKPEYTIIEVAGRTVTFNTYDIDSEIPIDTFTVTKQRP